jgi:CMP-N-acetylneuraminate monooxygenase
MCYAGMFSEKALRDNNIKNKNLKNTQEDYIRICKKNKTNFIYNKHDQILYIKDKKIKIKKITDQHTLINEDYEFYIKKIKEEHIFDVYKIKNYFINSKYCDNQIIQIIPTNDNFEWNNNKIFYFDFSNMEYKILNNLDDIIEKHSTRKVLTLKIREEILMCVINNMLPWEDFSIGFQSRIKRHPNIYESDLWFHFTNIYITKKNFRFSSFCGGCTVINQNPIWLK